VSDRLTWSRRDCWWSAKAHGWRGEAGSAWCRIRVQIADRAFRLVALAEGRQFESGRIAGWGHHGADDTRRTVVLVPGHPIGSAPPVTSRG
jgi:hypothetical protein